MEGFGRVVVELDEPLFHWEWEPRVRAMSRTVMASGLVSPAMFRHAVERMDPAHYLRAAYYERWLTALTSLLVEQGQVSASEVAGLPTSHPVAELDTARLRVGGSTPRFAVGDDVRVRDERFSGHTRCPAYVRGRRRTVVRADPSAAIAAHDVQRREVVREHVYAVRFALAELWGEGDGLLHVDLAEHHLDLVPEMA